MWVKCTGNKLSPITRRGLSFFPQGARWSFSRWKNVRAQWASLISYQQLYDHNWHTRGGVGTEELDAVTVHSIKFANQLISLFPHRKEIKMPLYIFFGESKENPPNFFKRKTSSNLQHNGAAATEFPWWVYSVIREIRGPAKYLFCLVVCQLKYWWGSLTATLFVCKNAEAKTFTCNLHSVEAVDTLRDILLNSFTVGDFTIILKKQCRKAQLRWFFQYQYAKIISNLFKILNVKQKVCNFYSGNTNCN